MKKFIVSISLIFVLTVCLSASVLGFVVYKNTEVAYAEDVQYIYASPSATITSTETIATRSSIKLESTDGTFEILFFLPTTYYAKIINSSDYYYTVEFLGRNYFINKSENPTVTPTIATFEEGQSPYPTASTTLTLNGVTSIQVNGNTVDASYAIRFIGEFDNDTYYVSAQNGSATYYGKVAKSSFNDYQLKVNPKAVVSAPPTGGDSNIKVPTTSKTLRIILIIGIIVPSVLIVVLLFLPTKKKNGYDKHIMKSKKRGDFDYDKERSLNRRYDDNVNGYNSREQRNYDNRRDYDYPQNDYDRNGYRNKDDRRNAPRDYDRDRDNYEPHDYPRDDYDRRRDRRYDDDRRN